MSRETLKEKRTRRLEFVLILTLILCVATLLIWHLP